MNCVTLLYEDAIVISKAISSHVDEKEELFENVDDRHDFAQLLDSVQDPLHPTRVFDMIVGTSTGIV